MKRRGLAGSRVGLPIEGLLQESRSGRVCTGEGQVERALAFPVTNGDRRASVQEFDDDLGQPLFGGGVQRSALAVIRWKKHFGFYADLGHEHHANFALTGNAIVNEDKA